MRDFLKVIAGRSAVHFLLRCTFVRVLEDMELIPNTLRGQRHYTAFQAMAPSLGLRSYFEWIFRDLAADFPDLFAERPDDLGPPHEELCREVWDLWHKEDGRGSLLYDWSGDGGGFESRFLGDLYQDLDQDVRKRFALLQTPDFVESYILDHTLTPALETFDPQALQREGRVFRLIDPTCGSGHFLIGAFHRLADWWEARGLDTWDAAETALESVWGCDINPHAIYIAQFRLMLEVMRRTGVRALSRLASLPMNLRALDSLVPWERREDADAPGVARLEHYGTAEDRAANAVFLGRDFHVVVGNPPYITPKDPQKRDDYRVFWPESATGQYGLAAPFVERLFAMGRFGAFVGQITGNAFIKRSFGASLVQSVLPRWDLTDVVDTSGAYIPGHGTPTVVLTGRCRVPASTKFRVIGGKRGEPKAPENPAQGLVWRAIAEAGCDTCDSSPFVTVSVYERALYADHPWNLNGGGAPELERLLAGRSHCTLGASCGAVGRTVHTGQDPVYFAEKPWFRLIGAQHHQIPLVRGTDVRDYQIEVNEHAVFPYSSETAKPIELADGLAAYLWRMRIALRTRKDFGQFIEERGLQWFEWSMFFPSRYLQRLSITFAFVATHNHFVLDRGGKVFNRTAPVIKLPAEATLEDHLDLLGLLNSSTLGFWMKQVFFDKGNGGIGGGIAAEGWERFFEYDSTKLQRAPITTTDRPRRVALAEALDATAQARAACLPAAVLAREGWTAQAFKGELETARQTYARHTERMVALQEELDWLTYHSYDLIELDDAVIPDGDDPTDAHNGPEPIAPGHRPFEIVLAQYNAICDPDERSAWFTRHGHDQVTVIPTRYSDATRARMDRRLGLIESNRDIKLIEQPQFKRRWQRPDLYAEAKKAARAWLLDRLEDLFADGGPLSEPQPYTLEEVVNAWRRDDRVAAVAAVHQDTHNFDLSTLAEQLLVAEALPDNPLRVYTADGLKKWRRWQHTWHLQDREDAGETVKIELPPKFAAGDFRRAEYLKIRGKLNVPRERFIHFADLTPSRYGWNGWRDEARAIAQVHGYQCAEDDPVDPLPPPTSLDPRRCGATIGLWEALPDLKRWGDVEVYDELSALPSEACGQSSCPCDISQAWQKWNLGKLPIEGLEAPDPDAATVAEKAQLTALLEAHQPPIQLQLDDTPNAPGGVSIKALRDAWRAARHPAGRFKRILDELIASGDVANLGRGKRGGLRTAL